MRFFFKMVQFVFDYIHISLANIYNALKILKQSQYVDWKFTHYLGRYRTVPI